MLIVLSLKYFSDPKSQAKFANIYKQLNFKFFDSLHGGAKWQRCINILHLEELRRFFLLVLL
jgi:hypothetical protein